MKASLEIRIWTDGEIELSVDLPEAFQPHLEHVAKMAAEGYIAGEIIDESFRGWWEIKTESTL